MDRTFLEGGAAVSKKVVIGIDESYTRTGVTILDNKKILCMRSVNFDNCKTNVDKRRHLDMYFRQQINRLRKQNKDDITIIVERIRLRSQGFLSEAYIKATGALLSVIIAIGQDYDIPVYSVDTRSWKAQVVGDSKPLQNPYGINPEKYRTILYLKQKGLLKYIVEEYKGKGTKGVINVKIDGEKVPCKINDDIADSYCIAAYGFLPEKQQRLKEEKF